MKTSDPEPTESDPVDDTLQLKDSFEGENSEDSNKKSREGDSAEDQNIQTVLEAMVNQEDQPSLSPEKVEDLPPEKVSDSTALASCSSPPEENLAFFKEKPIVSVGRIVTVEKNLFVSQRKFQIKTSPGGYSVFRCREDFKWLTSKLKEEYPTNEIIEIEKGQLSKKMLEDYFDYLMSKQGMNRSRSLKFFLCTDDQKFTARRERDEKVFSGFFSKMFKGNSVSAKDFNLSELKKSYNMSPQDEGNLHTYLDELFETIKLNKEYASKVDKYTTQISELFIELSTKVFNLANVFTSLHKNMLTIEKYCEKDFNASFRLSSCYEAMKTSLYSMCNELKQPAQILSSQLKPLCLQTVKDLQPIYENLKYRAELNSAYMSAHKKSNGNIDIQPHLRANPDGSGAAGSAGVDSKVSKLDIKLGNLNFQIFSEFVKTYETKTEVYHSEMLRMGRSFNEMASMSKKSWMTFVKTLMDLELERLKNIDETCPASLETGTNSEVKESKEGESA